MPCPGKLTDVGNLPEHLSSWKSVFQEKAAQNQIRVVTISNRQLTSVVQELSDMWLFFYSLWYLQGIDKDNELH